MHKVIKILGKFLLWGVLFFLFTPLFLSLLLAIPSIQNYVVDRAAAFASDKLGTVVHIEHVDVGFGGRILIDDFYVEDFQQDTLLYVKHLDAFLPDLGLRGSGLRFSYARARGAKLFLKETPSGEMNIRPVVLKISDPNRKKKGNFFLSLEDAAIEDMELRIERLQHRNPVYGIDYGNMRFEHINLAFDRFEIDGQVISADVRSASLTEQSGFVLEDLSGKFFLTNGALGFVDTRLKLPYSDLTIRELAIAGNAWTEYKRYVNEVEMMLRVSGSVATDDVAYFAPSMRRWQTRDSDVEVEMEGKVDRFEARINRAKIGDHTSLRAMGLVTGLPDWRKAHFDIRLTDMQTTSDEAARLAQNIAGVKLSPELRTMLRRTEWMDMAGHFDGTFAGFDSQLALSTQLGTAHVEAEVVPHPRRPKDEKGRPQHQLQARLAMPQFNLGGLLAREPLVGHMTAHGSLYSTISQRTIQDNTVMVDISDLEFKGYRYDTIRVAGLLREKNFNGRLRSDDPNLKVLVDGSVNWRDSIPHYDMTARLTHVDLAKLHFNERDTLSQFAGRLVVKAGGRSLDDLNGRIHLSNATYRYNDKQIKARSVTVEGVNSADRKLVQLHSDFADATFRSRTGYRTIYDYLRRSALRYLPLIGHTEDAAWQQQRRTIAVADEYSVLDLKIHDISAISDAISSGLQVANNSTFNLTFNPVSDHLSMKAVSDYIEHRNILVTRLHATASNQNDSLQTYVRSEDLYLGAIHLPQFSLSAGAKLGRVQLSLGFNDTVKHASGRLGLIAGPAAEEGPNGPVVEAYLRSSHLTRGDVTWQINARGFRFDTARIEVNRFMLSHEDQRLVIDGVASRRPEDSITLQMRNFEMRPFLQFADRLGYDVGGKLNGRALMTAALGHGMMTADISIDSLSANGLVAPPLRLTSGWDFKLNRAGVGVMDLRSRDTLLRGFYIPKEQRYYAHLEVDSLNMGLLDPVLKGVVSGTQGKGRADLIFKGVGRDADLSGRIYVEDMRTKVDFTQVEYTLPEGLIEVKKNRFRTTELPIFDPEGNRGTFALNLDMQHLTNIGYEVRVEPRQMLVLDTDEEDNDLFYGKIYASGSARIVGDKGQVSMDITARSEDNSLFFMPLSDKSNISTAEFVTFVKPKDGSGEDALTERKRRFERSRMRKSPIQNRMSIDMELNVRPNVEVEMMVSGSPIKARGEGTLTLDIEPQSNVFEMYGDYMITEGDYNFSLQNIISKRFEIENGSMIQWTGDPIDARLNIDAVYNLKTSIQPLLEGTTDNVTLDRSVPVECRIHLGDRLTNPSITFDVVVPDTDPETQAIISTALSTPESVDLQFLYLLIFNNFMSEGSALGTASMGSTASAASGLESLSNQLSRLLSVNDYNLVIRYRPKTEMTSDEVDFGLSKSLINNRLFVEVEGNYLLDNKHAVNSSMSNFMGEAYVTYLVDRSGALQLKAFTQTIDRFDENQGLQETGVGISYKEEFENFRDLRRRIKERFTSKKRKERKAAERAQADSLARVQRAPAVEQPDSLPADGGGVPMDENE